MSEVSGPSEKVVFDVGYGKGKIDANELVNTSKVPLMNGQKVLVKGVDKECGYYSHSALESYTRCSKQFEYRYILKKKPRLLPKLKMWGGSAIHEAADQAFNAKLIGEEMSSDAFVSYIHGYLDTTMEEFDESFKASTMKKEDPLPIEYTKTTVSQEKFIGLYTDVGKVFFDNYFPKIKPLATEELFIYHLEVYSGGTIPLVGFIDLIEEVDGEPVVTDHKVGMKYNTETIHHNMQLSLYSQATKISKVSINNFVVGTTGGQKGKGKPGSFVKLNSERKEKDYEGLNNNINQILKGIKAGSFPKSGVHNPIVCAPNQCPYFLECMKRT